MVSTEMSVVQRKKLADIDFKILQVEATIAIPTLIMIAHSPLSHKEKIYVGYMYVIAHIGILTVSLLNGLYNQAKAETTR